MGGIAGYGDDGNDGVGDWKPGNPDAWRGEANGKSGTSWRERTGTDRETVKFKIPFDPEALETFKENLLKEASFGGKGANRFKDLQIDAGSEIETVDGVEAQTISVSWQNTDNQPKGTQRQKMINIGIAAGGEHEITGKAQALKGAPEITISILPDSMEIDTSQAENFVSDFTMFLDDFVPPETSQLVSQSIEEVGENRVRITLPENLDELEIKSVEDAIEEAKGSIVPETQFHASGQPVGRSF